MQANLKLFFLLMSDLIIHEITLCGYPRPCDLKKKNENFDDASSFFILAVVCCIISILGLAIRCFVPFC